MQSQDYEVFFFDESRFGTHSRIGHGWFKTGTRTLVQKKLGYQNFYLYGAFSPKTGDSFSLIMPNVNVNWMNKFLEEFSFNLQSKKAILVMDQAGWHKSSGLIIPKNIKIIYLSPYSPELNPAEKMWQFIKDNILKNTIYNTLDDLEKTLCAFINTITKNQILSLCNISYMSYYL